MRFDISQQLTILAASTGLALASIFFAMLSLGVPTPDWLPMMVTGIGGFELSMFVNQQWRRFADRRAGGR